MIPNWTKPPLSYFVPPGEIEISAAALELGREFVGGIDSVSSKHDWVVAFDWSFARTMQYPDGREVDLGAGLDIGAYRRSDLPPDAIQRADDLEFAIKIPRELWETSEQRLIDYDATVLSKVVLR